MATRKKQSKVPETITSAAARLEELRGELLTVGESLADREVMVALADDAVLTEELADAVRGLLQVGTAVRDRLSSVARLSAQIDELADPLMIAEVA